MVRLRASSKIQIFKTLGMLIMKNQNLSAKLQKFHSDEAGLEALQVVMILAVAAVALIVVKTQWDVIRKWFVDVMGQGVGAGNWQTK